MPRRHRARERARQAARQAETTPTAAPSTAVTWVRDREDAWKLAQHLLDPTRRWPVVVVTTPSDAPRPHLDPTALRRELDEQVQVTVVLPGAPSWALTSRLPTGAQVYGGATRVYPAGDGWVEAPDRARLYVAWSTDDAPACQRRIVHDVANQTTSTTAVVGDDAPIHVPARVPTGAWSSMLSAPSPAVPTPAALAGLPARSGSTALGTPEVPAAVSVRAQEADPARAVSGRVALRDALHALETTRAELRREQRRAGAVSRQVGDLQAMVQERDGLIDELLMELAQRDRRIGTLQTKYRQLQRRHERAAASVEHGSVTEGCFTDPDEQFRHEVYLTWAELVPAAEKARWPLPGYAVGPDFVESLRLEGVSRRKVLNVVVHVLTGRASEVNGLQLHPLRAGESGNAAQVVREDGATCWRTALQVNSPSARRLHYWRRTDRSIELSRVVLHDDVAP